MAYLSRLRRLPLIDKVLMAAAAGVVLVNVVVVVVGNDDRQTPVASGNAPAKHALDP